MIHFKKVGKSFRYAWHGIALAAQEQTFRLLLAAAGIVTVLMMTFPLPGWQIVSLIIMMMVVLVLEVLNTAFERMVDLVEPKLHKYVQELKDLMAAAVLIASLAACIIGVVIFLPYFSRV